MDFADYKVAAKEIIIEEICGAISWKFVKLATLTHVGTYKYIKCYAGVAHRSALESSFDSSEFADLLTRCYYFNNFDLAIIHQTAA